MWLVPTVPDMAQTILNAEPATKDFTRKRKRLDFTINGDVFDAAPVLPGDVFAEFVTLYSDVGETETYQQQHDMLKRALELALLPESWQRFSARLVDKENPIDDDQMSDVILWLLEEYGMRPTQPLQQSSDGPASLGSGTPSTASTQPAASTSRTSRQIAS